MVNSRNYKVERIKLMKMTKLLLVEDDQNLGYLLKRYIELHDFEVVWVENAADALGELQQKLIDLCILDVNLPDQDGFSLAKKIRQINPKQPFIFLTARNLKADKLYGFKLGSDDYLTKPIDEEEMIARIKAVLNRTQFLTTEQPALETCQIGKYQFDYHNRQLIFQEKIQQLTHKENELLKLLYSQKGKILDRKSTLKQLWGQVDYFSRKSMDVYISKLRKYLKEDPQVSITNIHSKGFILSD